MSDIRTELDLLEARAALLGMAIREGHPSSGQRERATKLRESWHRVSDLLDNAERTNQPYR